MHALIYSNFSFFHLFIKFIKSVLFHCLFYLLTYCFCQLLIWTNWSVVFWSILQMESDQATSAWQTHAQRHVLFQSHCHSCTTLLKKLYRTVYFFLKASWWTEGRIERRAGWADFRLCDFSSCDVGMTTVEIIYGVEGDSGAKQLAACIFSARFALCCICLISVKLMWFYF